jgi:hypothetical protein
LHYAHQNKHGQNMMCQHFSGHKVIQGWGEKAREEENQTLPASSGSLYFIHFTRITYSCLDYKDIYH